MRFLDEILTEGYPYVPKSKDSRVGHIRRQQPSFPNTLLLAFDQVFEQVLQSAGTGAAQERQDAAHS